MKFIDELDIERVNQTLNFETADCKITGGCDIFTTKPVASDKKLYKTIDHHLETILQENESYKSAVQQQSQQAQLHLQSSPLEANAIPVTPGLENSRRDSSSFWEQKRRMSITDPLYAINNNIVNYTNAFNQNNNGNGNINNNGNGSNSPGLGSLTNRSQSNGNSNSLTTSPFIKSTKLNDQNLKELVMNSESEYASSSSMESANRANSNSNNGVTKPNLKRRTSSTSSLQSFKLTSLRRPSLNDADMNVNIGPFGPIREPASRRTFAYLIAILNASYPDHDFTSLEPNDFIRSSLKTFVSKFENSLYSLGKKPESWIWETINSHMTLSDCVVYQFNPTKSFLEDEPGYLWSLIGFLFNKKRKRVAFVYLICSRLKTISGDYNEDTMRPLRQYTIDYNDGFEGEYDLVNDDENAIADDSDDEF